MADQPERAEASAEIARRGMEELGGSAEEISRHLGVNRLSVTRPVASWLAVTFP